MTRWFTSDTHFNHKGILKHRTRFSTVDEMNEHLIAAHNSRVKKGDVVHHLGDVIWKLPFDFSRLNGSFILYRGNHDRSIEKKLHGWKVPNWEIRDVEMLKLGGQKIWVSHYEHRVWPEAHRGAWHIFGHNHGIIPEIPDTLSMEVGVDMHPDFAPFSLEEIKAHMANKA